MMKSFIYSCYLLLFFLCCPFFLLAQGTILPLNNERTYHIIDRLEIKTGINPFFHTTQKGFNRGDVTKYAIKLDTSKTIDLSAKDKKDLEYIFDDNNDWLDTPTFNKSLTEKSADDAMEIDISNTTDRKYKENNRPLLKYFFKTPANFFEYNSRYFDVKVNPILNISLGKDTKDTAGYLFQNQRGLEVRGNVDDRVYFYTNIVESQMRMPNYVIERINKTKAIPGNGLYKVYNSSAFKITNGYDFLNSQAYIGFNATKHIGATFGYGRNFIGDGIRSMQLSDFANNYLFLRFNTTLGRFQYQNIFAELASNSQSNANNRLLPKKYTAMHQLNYRIGKNFTLGIYEGVVFGRRSGFELHYLNPIIFYRTVEGALGSPDNAMVGANFKWNIKKKVSVYGQFLLDEFKFSEAIVNPNKGWWANKHGIQLGAKYIDAFGIDHLDIQAEYNVVRPYTYTHFDSTGSYSHNNQPLAHPQGANFREIIGIIRYQPTNNIFVQARIFKTQLGEDIYSNDPDVAKNYGSDILTGYNSRFSEYGNETLQGVRGDILMFSLEASYMIYHNLNLDLTLTQRKKTSSDLTRSNSFSAVQAGVRWNIGRYRSEF